MSKMYLKGRLFMSFTMSNSSQNGEMVMQFETRQDMLRGIPFTGHIAELGVFKGDFSADILLYCPHVHQLDLVDAWGLCGKTIISGDQDGNNIEKHYADHLELHVRERFKNESRVTLNKCLTKDYLSQLPDSSLDAVYIDADHSYEGCYNDLQLAFKKVRSGGYIAGHDYEIIKSKCKYNHQFGVFQAVQQFMKENSLKMHARANDGCVSFLIERP